MKAALSCVVGLTMTAQAMAQCITSTGATPTGANDFAVQEGQIIGPDLRPFVVRGIAVLDSEMSTTSPATIISQFPGINTVNLAIGADGNGYATAQSNGAIIDWVNAATSKGLVVILSDYVPGQPQVRGGGDLQASLDWYGSLAKTFANNPNVMWTTENEVGGNLGPMEQGIYNAIRGAGNNGLIFMEAQDGNATSTNGLDPGIYANMTGVGWNIHAYPWEFDTGSGNQASYDATLKGYVARFQNFAHSADGVMPVLIGEGGNSTSGNGIAPDDPIVNGKFAVTQSILETAGEAGGTSGYEIWLHDWHGSPGDGDELVSANGTLTDYGQQVAAAIAAGPRTQTINCVSVEPTATSRSLGPLTVQQAAPMLADLNAQADAVNAGIAAPIVTPGRGTATDAASNTFSVSPIGNVIENGQDVPGGWDTSAITTISGTLFGQDSRTGQWFRLNQQDSDKWWTPLDSPPAGLPSAVITQPASLPADVTAELANDQALLQQAQSEMVAVMAQIAALQQQQPSTLPAPVTDTSPAPLSVATTPAQPAPPIITDMSPTGASDSSGGGDDGGDSE
jgi:Cellulase (glycosyl hydrolase family 5)